jgi:hypothetical protein
VLPPGTVARLRAQNGPVPNQRLYTATGQKGPVTNQRLCVATGRRLPVVALAVPMAGSLRKRAALVGALSPTCP